MVGLLWLSAESTESLLSLATLLLVFPLTEKAAAAGVAALVEAPKLGPTVCTPPTNIELVVLRLLTVGKRIVEGNPNPTILRFFCATPPTPKYDPAPANEAEEVDSSIVRAAIGRELALNAPTSKLDVERRSVDASLAWACVESLSLLDLDLEDFDDDFLDFLASSPRLSGSSVFLLFVFFSLPSFIPIVSSPSSFSFAISSPLEPLSASSIAPLNCAQLPIRASDLTTLHGAERDWPLSLNRIGVRCMRRAKNPPDIEGGAKNPLDVGGGASIPPVLVPVFVFVEIDAGTSMRVDTARTRTEFVLILASALTCA